MPFTVQVPGDSEVKLTGNPELALTGGVNGTAPNTWFAADAKGQLSAFLQKDAASAYAKANQGRVLDFSGARSAAKTSL